MNKFNNIYNKNFHNVIKEKYEIIEMEAETYKNKYPFSENKEYEYDVDAMCQKLDIIL